MTSATTPYPLPARMTEVIVQVIRQAYKENAPLQLRELGHDDWTFALANFTTIKHFLVKRLSEEDVLEKHGKSLWISYGGCKVYIHKLGRSERDDPWSSLPQGPGPAGYAAVEQLTLFEIDEIVEPRIWVVGHYGSLDDGICAIRLQASGAAEEGKIRSWVRVNDLWERPDQGLAIASPHRPDAPAPIDVGEPQLEVKRAGERERVTGEEA